MPIVAVVGTGFIGPVHIEALHRLGITVRGVLSATPEKTQEAAQQLRLEIAYPSFEAILEDPLVEVIHITTPNNTHFDFASRALLAGKHVICEKPLAMDADETAKLVEIAKQHPHLVSAVNYNLRFYPMVLHARDIIQSGAIGEIYNVRGAYIQDWLLFDTDWNWRLLPEAGGKLRAIGDIGTHWMDMIAFITGLKVESLLADLSTFVPVRQMPTQAVATFQDSSAVNTEPVTITTEDWASVLFHYAGGARGNMSVSQVNAGRKNQLTFEIAGSKGAVSWDSENPNALWVGHRDTPNEIIIKDPAFFSESTRRFSDYPGGHAEGFPDTFKQLYKAIYGYIAAGDFSQPKPFPTFEDGHHEVHLCDTILQSHQERKWLDL